MKLDHFKELSIKRRIQELEKYFSQLPTWEEKYQKIIALGKSLPPISEEEKVEDLKVKGCQSQVWLLVHRDESTGQLYFQADSDALIAKGLVALLVSVYSWATPSEILETPPDFIKNLGFAENLSPSRSNGLYAMLKQIQYYALAFKVRG